MGQCKVNVNVVNAYLVKVVGVPRIGEIQGNHHEEVEKRRVLRKPPCDTGVKEGSTATITTVRKGRAGEDAITKSVSELLELIYRQNKRGRVMVMCASWCSVILASWLATTPSTGTKHPRWCT